MIKMTTGEKPTPQACRCVTRRRLIALSVLAAGSAHAQQAPKITKASKQLAGYIEKTPYATQTCVSCHFFIDPDDCEIVEGPVNPTGYCNYYTD